MSKEQGLSSLEAERRLAKYGPNEAAKEKHWPLALFLHKFVTPVAWMLEAIIVLQLIAGKQEEAIAIALLLLLNAIVAFIQEGRASKALALLRKNLNVMARVLRDGRWQRMSARSLVPGDVIRLAAGDFVPADMELLEGEVQLDLSMLTGESLPVEATAGDTAYCGSVVKRGEATGRVKTTGAHTHFGKTTELVSKAKSPSHHEAVIFSLTKYLILLNLGLVALFFAYAKATGIPMAEAISFALVLLLASVPAALPVTFTITAAFGALGLSKRGVLVTRLSAIEEAAAMDVLVCDKTGTITENRLTLSALNPFAPFSSDELLRLAALSCNEATQDPIDLAILAAAAKRNLLSSLPPYLHFIPFDPKARLSEAWFKQEGKTRHVLKGAPGAIAALAAAEPKITAETERLTASGYRVLAVAAGDGEEMKIAGLLALSDQPRPDSASVVRGLQELGVRVIMATGDNRETARTIASQVGIGERICQPQVLHSKKGDINECDVFARMFPEEKLLLVKALQDSGRRVGMTGDGINDAPALAQAEIGIAVANATDVAKAASGLVLTNPGLSDVLAAVEESRRIYRRMLTYTLNMAIKKMEIPLFLALATMLTGTVVMTPLLFILMLFAFDLTTMTVATDRVDFSCKPQRWRIFDVLQAALPLAVGLLLLSLGVFFAGRSFWHLPLAQLQTVMFLLLVFAGLGNLYVVRESRHFWQSRPGGWLIFATLFSITAVSIMAGCGILMEAVSPLLIAGVMAVTLIYLAASDFLKVYIFRRFGFAQAGFFDCISPRQVDRGGNSRAADHRARAANQTNVWGP